MKSVDLNNLEINENEKHTSEALIRGIAYRFKELGYRIGGFEGMGHCNVLMEFRYFFKRLLLKC